MVPKHHDGGICTVRGCRSGGMARPDYPPPRHRTRLPTASCSQPSDNPLTRPGGQFSPTHARSHANKVPHREAVAPWGDTSKRYHDIAFARATAPASPYHGGAEALGDQDLVGRMDGRISPRLRPYPTALGIRQGSEPSVGKRERAGGQEGFASQVLPSPPLHGSRAPVRTLGGGGGGTRGSGVKVRDQGSWPARWGRLPRPAQAARSPSPAAPRGRSWSGRWRRRASRGTAAGGSGCAG